MLLVFVLFHVFKRLCASHVRKKQKKKKTQNNHRTSVIIIIIKIEYAGNNDDYAIF